MDNITHALVGAAMAEVALPPRPAPGLRRIFVVTGVVAASAPDVDLAYTWITEAPLGYLLHHRGHTHTWPGLMALAALILATCRYWPDTWSVAAPVRTRLALLVTAALASHLLLDAGNVYGTHLFYPFATGWYYGDAVFIFEPWLWLLLAAGLAASSHAPWWRRGLWAMAMLLPLALMVLGVLTFATVAAIALGGVLLFVVLHRLSPARRAAAALIATVAAIGVLFALSGHAKAHARQHLAATGDNTIVDIAANPNPGVPWCWSLVTLEQSATDELIVRRGTVSLLPSWRPATTCASDRLFTSGAGGGSPAASDVLRWNRQWTMDRLALQGAAADCRGAAWLQFGRTPYVDGRVIVDLRFDNPIGSNFTEMRLDVGAADHGCPSRLTRWAWPRADVLHSIGP